MPSRFSTQILMTGITVYSPQPEILLLRAWKPWFYLLCPPAPPLQLQLQFGISLTGEEGGVLLKKAQTVLSTPFQWGLFPRV